MKHAVTALAMILLAAGCGGAPSGTPGGPAESGPGAAETPENAPAESNAIPMRDFAAVTIGPYGVQPMYEEEIVDGHFNFRITGGEFRAVRIWVGEEDPGDVMVVKTELENEYQHGHVEIPNPIPDGYALWIEVETPDGELHKGSTPLKPAP